MLAFRADARRSCLPAPATDVTCLGYMIGMLSLAKDLRRVVRHRVGPTRTRLGR